MNIDQKEYRILTRTTHFTEGCTAHKSFPNGRRSFFPCFVQKDDLGNIVSYGYGNAFGWNNPDDVFVELELMLSCRDKEIFDIDTFSIFDVNVIDGC